MDEPQDDPPLVGELTAPPRGAFVTAVLALSGVALVRALARLVLRLALAYRRPAELRLGPHGLAVSSRTELLGRVLGRSETVIPLSNLSRVTREVRYPRLGLYVGLAALVAGTYLGTGLIVDGARVPGGSPSLLGMGLVAVLLGIALDYGLVMLGALGKEKCRLVVVPQAGPALCVQGIDQPHADRVLTALAAALPSATGPATTDAVTAS